MIVNKEVEPLSDKIADHKEEAGVDGVVWNIVVANAAYTIC